MSPRTAFISFFALVGCADPRETADPESDAVEGAIWILPGDEVEIRPSGEVHVQKTERWAGLEITVAFQDEPAFQEALRTTAELDLSGEHDLIVIGDDGLPRVVRDTVEGAVRRARGTLCGTTSARMIDLTLESGEPVFVSFAHVAISNEAVEPTDDLFGAVAGLASSCDIEVELDVFDDCDVFALGGCGGPSCVNVLRCIDHGRSVTVNGDCTPHEVFGPDTCFCSG